MFTIPTWQEFSCEFFRFYRLPRCEAKLQASKPRISANVAGRNAMGSPDLDEKNLQRWVDPLDKADSLGSPRDNSHLSYPKKKGTTGYKQFYIQPIWQFGDCSLFDICLIYIFVDPAITLVDLLLFGRLQFMWCLIANLVVLRFHWGLWRK